jgi:hypothetical protein
LRQYPRRGLNLKYGERANDKQLDAFIAQQKGRRGPNRGLAATPKTVTSPGGARRRGDVTRAANTQQKKEAETALEKFFREAEEKIEEANNANESRYNQIMGDLDARYNRVMDRIQNFGHAARADLQERAAEALGNIHANLSARGLGNSTVLAAFQQRNARDLAREQQRLSETVDTRAMNADMQMTADKAGFMERREDVAPDWGQIQEMAMKYGLGNEGRGFADTAQGLPPGPQAVVNDYRNQGGGSWAPPPGAVAAGRNRGPMFWGNPYQNMSFLTGGTLQGGGPGYTYTPTERGASKALWDTMKAGQQYELGATDVPLPPRLPPGPVQIYKPNETDVPIPPNFRNRPVPGRSGMGVTNKDPGRAGMGVDQSPGRSGMGLQDYPSMAPPQPRQPMKRYGPPKPVSEFNTEPPPLKRYPVPSPTLGVPNLDELKDAYRPYVDFFNKTNRPPKEYLQDAGNYIPNQQEVGSAYRNLPGVQRAGEILSKPPRAYLQDLDRRYDTPSYQELSAAYQSQPGVQRAGEILSKPPKSYLQDLSERYDMPSLREIGAAYKYYNKPLKDFF